MSSFDSLVHNRFPCKGLCAVESRLPSDGTPAWPGDSLEDESLGDVESQWRERPDPSDTIRAGTAHRNREGGWRNLTQELRQGIGFASI